MTEHEIVQKAFSNNRERLKAERLAREDAGPRPRKPKPPRQRENDTIPFRGRFGACIARRLPRPPIRIAAALNLSCPPESSSRSDDGKRYQGSVAMPDIMLPSLKERLWHKMRGDLATYIPELDDNQLLMCCACGRFLTRAFFDAASRPYGGSDQSRNSSKRQIRQSSALPKTAALQRIRALR